VPRSRADFDALRERVAGELTERTTKVLGVVVLVLSEAHEVRAALPAKPLPVQVEAIEDVQAQFRRLLPTGFVAAVGSNRLPDLARYLSAIARRLERLPRDVDTDLGRMHRVRYVQQAYDELVRALPATRAAAVDVRDIGWLIEELRVSLWAQQLGTSRPVSEQRIYRAIDAIAP
jgi:ATP-dependent helicase HrpA